MRKVFFIFLTWFFIINLFSLIALNRLNLSPDTSYVWINPKEFFQKQSWSILDLHTHWDSYWFLDIVKNGYYFRGQNIESNFAFFPIYPTLVYLVSLILTNPVLSGWLVSSIFLLLSCIYLYKITKEFHPEIKDPLFPVLFLLIFPTAVFFNSVYTESTFLFFSLLCFYYALKRNFLYSAIFGSLAALTRSTGFTLFFPIIFEYLESRKFKPDLKITYLLAIPASTLAYLFYLYYRFGDFWLYFKVQSWWGRSFKLTKEHFTLNSNPSIVNFSLDIFFVLIALVAAIYCFRKLRISYALYIISVVVLALSTGTTLGIGRFVLILFPIYIMLANLKSNLIQLSFAFLSILLLGLYATLFISNYWAG